MAEIVTKHRGTILIDKQGQTYFKTGPKFSSDGRLKWRCSKYRNECRVKVDTQGEMIVRRFGVHNHLIKAHNYPALVL